jgi:hypothetical protein
MRALIGFAVVLFSSVAVAGSPKPVAKKDLGPQFDKDAAAVALKSVDLVKCKIAGGPRGEGHVFVTFANDGGASNVEVDRGPFVRSPVERCIVGLYKVAKVPAFKGEPVRVGKTFRID